MWERTISRVTAAKTPHGEFYDFYSVSLENFGSTHVESLYIVANLDIQLGSSVLQCSENVKQLSM